MRRRGRVTLGRPKSGSKRLSVARMDATHIAFRANAFDIVTMFELLEHCIPSGGFGKDARRLATPVCVVLSMPSCVA